MLLRSNDLSKQVSTAGTIITGSNINRQWMAFSNLGSGWIDIYWLDSNGQAAAGRLRLQAGQSVAFDRNMYWDGAISATAEVNNDILSGVEVEKWGS